MASQNSIGVDPQVAFFPFLFSQSDQNIKFMLAVTSSYVFHISIPQRAALPSAFATCFYARIEDSSLLGEDFSSLRVHSECLSVFFGMMSQNH
jgi:hypothetical protein